MRNRVLLALMIVVSIAASAARAQSNADVPRLADGRPDLQGVWDFRTITPLERPTELGDKAVLTAEEAAALQAAANK